MWIAKNKSNIKFQKSQTKRHEENKAKKRVKLERSQNKGQQNWRVAGKEDPCMPLWSFHTIQANTSLHKECVLNVNQGKVIYIQKNSIFLQILPIMFDQNGSGDILAMKRHFMSYLFWSASAHGTTQPRDSAYVKCFLLSVFSAVCIGLAKLKL